MEPVINWLAAGRMNGSERRNALSTRMASVAGSAKPEAKGLEGEAEQTGTGLGESPGNAVRGGRRSGAQVDLAFLGIFPLDETLPGSDYSPVDCSTGSS